MKLSFHFVFIALIENHRVHDPCCHSCPAPIAICNLQHSIKTGNKAKKRSVCVLGQWEPLKRRSKKAFKGRGRRNAGRQTRERSKKKGGIRKERKRVKRKPFLNISWLTLGPVYFSILKHDKSHKPVFSFSERTILSYWLPKSDHIDITGFKNLAHNSLFNPNFWNKWKINHLFGVDVQRGRSHLILKVNLGITASGLGSARIRCL